MSVTLTNTTRRVCVVILTHDGYCARVGRCGCSARRDGALLPTSLTLPAREPVAGVDEAALALPQIAAAVRAGEIRVAPEEPVAAIAQAPAEPSVPAPPAAEPNDPRRPERRPDQSRRGAR